MKGSTPGGLMGTVCTLVWRPCFLPRDGILGPVEGETGSETGAAANPVTAVPASSLVSPLGFGFSSKESAAVSSSAASPIVLPVSVQNMLKKMKEEVSALDLVDKMAEHWQTEAPVYALALGYTSDVGVCGTMCTMFVVQTLWKTFLASRKQVSPVNQDIPIQAYLHQLDDRIKDICKILCDKGKLVAGVQLHVGTRNGLELMNDSHSCLMKIAFHTSTLPIRCAMHGFTGVAPPSVFYNLPISLAFMTNTLFWCEILGIAQDTLRPLAEFLKAGM